VVVSAGHGIYYNYEYEDWLAQRDPSNGITEDFITPGYATELSTWLSARSGATTPFTRSTATDLHQPSGQPWWKMGARYHLEVTYPDNPEIWHSLPNAPPYDMWERDEDIRSRPLLANHIGAGTILHLHTNAADDTSATGARAFYHTGRAADQQLANNILCYMKELIQAKETYKNYTVASQSVKATKYGENRLAEMPSVIVESGFHTNASDAVALQDPEFRTAAMKGVEKGYRLNAAGKTMCTPFKITSIPDVSTSNGTSALVSVNYEGYPQFAVKAKIEIVSCPTGWTCWGGEGTYSSTPSPLSYWFGCNGSAAGTIRLRTTLSDTDGVTNAVEHNVTCTTATARLAPGVAPTSTPSMSIGAGTAVL
jgi:hypothetical protein